MKPADRDRDESREREFKRIADEIRARKVTESEPAKSIASRAEALFAEAAPYLKELLASAPKYGTAGIMLAFVNGEIVRVDVSASVQRKAAAK